MRFQGFMLLVVLTQSVAAQEVPSPIETHRVHNVWRLSPRIMSGSEPEDESAIAELAKLGVQTIVSVDGIAPKVEVAKRFGLRYVHIPIGYDGIDERARGLLTRVAKDVQGSIYIHCHHGKHRGPAAAAFVCRADDGRSAEAALAILEKAGTGKEYPGLWRDVELFAQPTGPLPALTERAEVESLASAMARIDRSVDRLQLLSKSQWKPSAVHPDLLANSEAVQLAELFTEAARVAKAGNLQVGLRHAASVAEELQQAVRNGQEMQADKSLKLLTSGCAACHKEHRN